MVIAEIKDAKRAGGSKGGGVTFDFFDLGFFEEEDFHAFDFGRVFGDRFHCGKKEV